MSEWYQGMTFVYGKGVELEKVVAIVKILMKKGFKWVWSSKKGGYGLEWHRNKYILKKYRDREINRLIVYSGAEWLANVEAQEIKEIEEKDLISKIREYNKQKDRINLYSIPFPPIEYYKECGMEYDRDNPFPSDELIINEDGNKVEVYEYKDGAKEAIIVDFWSLHRYFEYSEPPLSVAVEKFAVDLMREIAMETEPVYAYMDLNEYRPLENDPVCENMKGLVRYNSKFGKGMYVEAGQIFYIKKEIIEKECGKELAEVYHPYYEDRYRVFIEELGDHYLMYGEDFVYTKNYPIYRCLNRDREYELLSKIPEGIVIKGVCGDIESGLKLKVSSYSGDEGEKEIIKKIEEWGKRYGVRIIDIRVS